MITRSAAIGLILAAGAAAQAQELMVVSFKWTEMIAGTNTPVLAPNGILDPGEGALIEYGFNALRNGTNAIGQVITFVNSAGQTVTGPISCIGGFVYDVVGSGADATGTWTTRRMSPIFNAVPELGLIWEGGARVHSIGGAQMIHIPSPIDPTNPIPLVWRGVWNPTNYNSRTVHFRVESSDTVPVGQQNSVDIEAGLDPRTGYMNYFIRYFPTDFGPGLNIPINPGGSIQSVCYPNCDGSTGSPALTGNDFLCFMNLYAEGNTIANCDGSFGSPVLTANDFMCYLNKYVSSCP